MKKRVIYGVLTALLTANLFLGARIYFRSAAAAEKDSAYPNLELFSYVMEKVRKDYVDGRKLTYQQLVYGALKGMINTLDPHSEFMDPGEYDELTKDTEGAFGGLGVMIEQKENDDCVSVLAPMEDSPGYKAGLLTGDRILKIDGQSAKELGLTDTVKRLRGEPGTSVTLTINRPSSGETRDFKLTREVITVDMVRDINNKRDFPLGPDKIGYVRLVQFGEKTSDELERALTKLKGQGMQALVLDLRWNPGGLLDQAVEVCQKFLPPKKLIVSTEGQNAAQSSRHYAGGHGDELDGMPLVVLVNVHSASASEIVAGCLQDYHRAEIMGERSFGKGSVQSILPLQDGSALRLTTAKYYTPSHKVIHGKGITPDCPVPVTDEEDQAVYMKLRPGLETLTEPQQDEIKNTRDVQYDRAVDLLRGILIYSHHLPSEQKVASNTPKTSAVHQ